MTIEQAKTRLRLAGIDLETAPLIEIIDELVEYAFELGLQNPFGVGDDMAFACLKVEP